MHIEAILLRNFRNYQEARLSFSPEGAVLYGANGSGKTNILEAIHVLCTARSQRCASRRDMIRFGEDTAYIEADFKSDVIEQSMSASFGMSRDRKVSMRLNDVIVENMAQWLRHGTVISFGPDDIGLVTQGPDLRRRFLDILLSQLNPPYLNALIEYRRLLLQRNALLNGAFFDSMQMDIYDERFAAAAQIIMDKRRDSLEMLDGFFSEVYASISAGKESAHIRYSPSFVAEKRGFDKEFLLRQLEQRRETDRNRGFSTLGPHRDDFVLLMNARPARGYASQGQRRSLALSLRLASISLVEQISKEPLIFILDDAVSELDQFRTQRIYPLIQGKGQAIIATPFNDPSISPSLPRYLVSEGGAVAQ